MRTDYEQLAGRYDEDRAGWSLSRDDVVDELLASCPVVRVLDLGCGTGPWLGAQRDFFGDARVEWLGAETIAIDIVRFWPPAQIADALETRGFTVEVNLDTGSGQMPAGHAVADAERRVLSHLALLNDDAYARGLGRLRHAAAFPDATVPTAHSRLRLTARRR